MADTDDLCCREVITHRPECHGTLLSKNLNNEEKKNTDESRI